MLPTFLLWHWRRLAEEVWKPLHEMPRKAPDLFIQLARKTAEHLHQGIAPTVVQDEKLAYRWLCDFDAADNGCREEACAILLEKWAEALRDLSPSPVERYRKLIDDFLRNNNIRYFFRQDKVGFRLTTLLSERFEELRSLCIGDNDLKESFEIFEKRIAQLMHKPEDLEAILNAASNLLERSCKKKAKKGRTLKSAAKKLGKVFPHQKINDSMCCMYDFFSDYPNIRHDGTDAHKLRGINGNDMLAISGIALMFILLLRSEEVPYYDRSMLPSDHE